MNKIYPERNPFPYEASLIIDSVEHQAGTMETGPGVLIPTLLTPPVRQLHDMIRRYFSQYDPSTSGKGLPVALSGDHGTGKTHAIRYTMSLVTSGELRPSAGGLQPYQLYARAETADFMEIYKQIMHQVPLAMLRDLTLRFLGVVGSEIYGASMASDLVVERATQVVIQDPEVVNRAFREYVVGESEAKNRQADEIQRTVGKEENFQNVIGYLLRDDLAETAYRWLIGDNVSEGDRKKLGVSVTIHTPALARWGLRFLATIFGRGGRPLIIYIDQYEKLILGMDGVLISENTGLMRALVDEIREASSMLVFAGNLEAWQAISQVRDLRQRFGANLIEFPVLTYENASKLICLYLAMGRNHLLEVWPLEGGQATMQLRGHALTIRAIVVSRDGQQAISASKDSTIKIWNLKDQENVRTLYGHQGAVNAVALTPDQKHVISGGDDHTVRVWDLENGRELFTLVGHENWVNAVVVTPDGRYAYSGSSDLTIRSWELETGKPVDILRGHRDTIWSLAVTPDGKMLVSASSDSTVRIWDLPGGELRLTLPGHTAWVNTVECTLDGRHAISASDDKTIRIWDLEKGQVLHILAGHTQPVRALCILPDGDHLISTAADDTYNIWDLKRGELSKTIKRPTSSMSAFAVIPTAAVHIVSALSVKSRESNDDIYPFEPNAVRTMLQNGGGNVRKLLQMCANSFALAFKNHQTIDEGIVEQTLHNDKRIAITRTLVTKEIEKLIAEHSLPFTRRYKVGNSEVDFAVLAPDGTPRLLVQLSEALFFKEEADHAMSSVNLIDQVRHYNLPAQVILVVVGYASPQVTELLRTVAHEAIIYDPDSFALKFGEVLDRLRTSLPTLGHTGEDINALKSDLDQVKEALARIVTTRSHETSSMEEQLKKILAEQSLGRSEKEGRNVRSLWLQERKQIEERIRDVRKNQQKADLEEIERLRKKAASDLNQRRIWVAFLFGVLGLLIGSGLTLYLAGVFYVELLSTALTAGLFTMVIFAAIGAFGYQFAQPRRLRELASEVTSIEELNRLAKAAVLPRQKIADNQLQIRQLLRSPNPHFRYAGALAADQKTDCVLLLMRAIIAERSTLVRRVIARQLAYVKADVDQVFDTVSFDSTPELAYFIEIAAATARLSPSDLTRLPGILQTLAAIATKSNADVQNLFKNVFKSSSLAFQLAVSELLDESESSRLRALKRAFQTGLSGDLSYLQSIPELHIQYALREFSPFEEGGLGTFDDLDNISTIDQYYIFFRQLAFYNEHGLLAKDE